MLLWFENDGKSRDDKLWKRHLVAKATLPGVYDVTLGDFDSDLDVVMALGMLAAADVKLTLQVAWYDNVGKNAKGLHHLSVR